jgi:hypothetical protein
MREKSRWALAAALVVIAAALAGCGTDKNGEANGRQAASLSDARRGKAHRKTPMAQVMSLERAQGAPVAAAPDPTAPTPKELVGVWEKTDLPGRGMRVELPAAGGLAEVRITMGPSNDAEEIAFFAEKSGGDKAVAARKAECFAKNAAPGKTKFKRLTAAGTLQWSGIEIIALYPMAAKACESVREQIEPVVLKLAGPDTLVVTKAPALQNTPPSPNAPAAEKPLSIWKRVVDEKAAVGKPTPAEKAAKPTVQKKP